MGKQLVITLSEEATEKYLQLAREQTRALLDVDYEPTDVLLKVNIAPDTYYDSDVLFGDTEIGQVAVSFMGDEQH